MSRKKIIGSRTLFDPFIPDHKSLHDLDDVYNLIDWKAVEQLLSPIYNSREGALSYPSIVMFRALLLQIWHNLSDCMLEKMLGRDLLFKRFSGFSLADQIPDHSTISRFRAQLIKNNLYEKLLSEINDQISKKGAIIKLGEISVVDATVIEAHQCRKKAGVNTDNTQDPEAGWSVKKGAKGKTEYTYGFKAHVNADEDGFVKKVNVTAGNVHDSNQLESLLTKTEEQLYADSAYKSEKTQNLCKDNKIEDKTHFRGYRNTPLTEEQKLQNKLRSSIRYVIEQVFGGWKKHYGASKTRYLGIKRTECWIHLISIVHNIKKASNILCQA